MSSCFDLEQSNSGQPAGGSHGFAAAVRVGGIWRVSIIYHGNHRAGYVNTLIIS